MSRENRQKQNDDANSENFKAPDQQPDQEPEKPGGAPRLGKEAKIGAAVIFALLAALAVVAIIRFSGWHSAGPAAAASAKGKAGAASKDKHNPDLDRHGSCPVDRAGTAAAPVGGTQPAPSPGSPVCDSRYEGSGTRSPDADPFGAGGFPVLTAPTIRKPEVIERHRAGVSQPPSDDPFRSRPPKAASPLRGSGILPTASSDRPHAPAARAEPARKAGDRYAPIAVPPPPQPDRGPRERGGYAAGGGESSVPPVHRERGRYDDLDTEQGGPIARSSYRDVPPRRDPPPYQASAAGMRREYRAGRAYAVAKGETLFTIARYELGNASRWIEIYELNRDALGKDFNNLTPGTKLLLPASERAEVLAEPTSNIYRR
jgi:nucleoid-associated protein YgaU